MEKNLTILSCKTDDWNLGQRDACSTLICFKLCLGSEDLFLYWSLTEILQLASVGVESNSTAAVFSKLSHWME